MLWPQNNFHSEALNSSRHLSEQICPGTAHLTFLDVVGFFSEQILEGGGHEECENLEPISYSSYDNRGLSHPNASTQSTWGL